MITPRRQPDKRSLQGGSSQAARTYPFGVLVYVFFLGMFLHALVLPVISAPRSDAHPDPLAAGKSMYRRRDETLTPTS